MFWGSKEKKKSQTLNEFYQNKNIQDYDWSNYYRPNRKGGGYGWGEPPGAGSGQKTVYRIIAVLSILALLLAVRQMNSPVGEDVRVGLRYILTTDWNVRPAMEKAVKFGLQMAGAESQLDSGMPQEGTVKEAMGNSTPAGRLMIPVSGKVIREYGWNKDSMDDLDRFHPGIDIAVGPGSAVRSALPGKVKKIGVSVQYGRYILMDHGDGVYTLYAGLGNVKVTEGQVVKAGESLGDIAKNGDIKGGGLHFELREKGALVDPLSRLDLRSER